MRPSSVHIYCICKLPHPLVGVLSCSAIAIIAIATTAAGRQALPTTTAMATKSARQASFVVKFNVALQLFKVQVTLCSA